MDSLLILGCGWSIFLIGLPGCVIPLYQQPQGFSSTYYQELKKVTATQAASVTSPAPATSSTTISSARVSGPNDLLPVPKPIELADTPKELDEEPVASNTGSWWSWIRRPLTNRSPAEMDSRDENVLPVPQPVETTDTPQERDEEPTASNTGSWWSWIRRPLTFRSRAETEVDDLDADDTPVLR